MIPWKHILIAAQCLVLVLPTAVLRPCCGCCTTPATVVADNTRGGSDSLEPHSSCCQPTQQPSCCASGNAVCNAEPTGKSSADASAAADSPIPQLPCQCIKCPKKPALKATQVPTDDPPVVLGMREKSADLTLESCTQRTISTAAHSAVDVSQRLAVLCVWRK